MDEITEPVVLEVPEVVAPEAVAAPVAPEAVAPEVVAPAAPRQRIRIRHQRQASAVNPVTATVETITVVTDDAAAELPAVVTLAAPYAFYDDAGALQSWAAGQAVADAAVIALLVDRGAIFEAE